MDDQKARIQLCQNLINAREKAKLTRKQVALKAGLNYSYYCKIENNKAEPRFTRLVNIAKVLGISRDELFKNC